MKRTLWFATATILTLGFGLFSFAHTAGADMKNPEIQAEPVETLLVRVTAYASVPDETDNTPFITANGTHVHDGIVASNVLPFGTQIQIPKLFGDKVFTVEDRMNKRIKNTIDIWMPSVSSAVDFGMTHTSIIVLGNKPVPVIGQATTKNADL
jgi:3D (Asp-Asp-Asp) domain-containing protein